MMQSGSQANLKSRGFTLNSQPQRSTQAKPLPRYNLTDNQIQAFLGNLEDFNKEFGYSKDPKEIEA
jgi:hypothetical protein